MISLDELRFGNWIKTDNSDVWINEFNLIPKVYDRSLCYKFLESTENENNFSYIELSQNLIEKLGFSKYSEKDNIFSFKDEYIYIIKDINGHFYMCDVYGHIVANTSLKYVHLLQNFFYLATERELNDIIAYNYYLKLHRELTGFDGSIPFEHFVKIIKNPKDKHPNTLKSTSICEKMPYYNIGDLPKDLFI